MKVINLEGEFGWDINVESIRPQLEDANGDDLDVYLASPGGSVFRGIHVYNLFRDYKRKYPDSQNTLTVQGLAASMSSYLMMCPAFDLIAVEDNAIFMMHNPYGGVVGDYRDAQSFYKMIEGLTDMMSDAYVKKLKKPKSVIREMLDDEFWAFGEDIVKQGFADEVLSTDNDKNKDSAYAMATMQVNELNKKIRNDEIKSEDIQEIAAMLKPNEAQTPAQDTRENNKTEESSMALKELLEQNPAAKIEYDNELKMKYEAGVTEGQNAMKVTIEKASMFINSADYPVQIKNAAIEVVLGKKSIDALDSMVATADMIKEMQKSNDAKNDTEKLGETTAQNTPQPSNDGVIRNDVDFMAEVERSKKIIGVEVK